MDATRFLQLADLDAQQLEAWVSAGWLCPTQGATGWSFAKRDLTRVRLIRDLRDDLKIGPDAITAVLGLLGEIQALRRMLRALFGALRGLPAPVGDRVRLELLDRTRAQPRHRRVRKPSQGRASRGERPRLVTIQGLRAG